MMFLHINRKVIRIGNETSQSERQIHEEFGEVTHRIVKIAGFGAGEDDSLMWDSPLYSMNMFYYHWLLKKLFWPMA